MQLPDAEYATDESMSGAGIAGPAVVLLRPFSPLSSTPRAFHSIMAASPLHPAALLRLHTRATIDHSSAALAIHRPIKIITDGRTGNLVFPVESAAFADPSLVLHLPDDHDESLQLLTTIEQVPDWRNDEACDRWQAFHGKPDRSTWARAHIDAAKFLGRVIDEAALCSPDPLCAHQGPLCKFANADRELLTRAVAAATGTHFADTLIVGVDAWGFDIRLPFGVLRITFTTMAASLDHAKFLTAAWLASPRPPQEHTPIDPLPPQPPRA